MKLFNVLLFLLITNLAFAQFEEAEGCWKSKYVPTVLDSTIEIIPAVIQYTPAVYTNITDSLTVKPAYVEKYVECVNGEFISCKRSYPAVKIAIVKRKLVIPEAQVIICPAKEQKIYSIKIAGHMERVPCTN